MGLRCDHGNYSSMPLRGVFKRTQRVVYECLGCGMEVERAVKLADCDWVEALGGRVMISRADREYRTKLFLRSLRGMGDQIYLRPFLREYSKRYDEIWIDSSFPELFHDIPNVRVYQLGGHESTESLYLRFHKKSEKAHRLPYAPTDYSAKEFMTYNMNDLRSGKTILESFNKFVVPEPFDFSLNVKQEWVDKGLDVLGAHGINGKYLILKAPTIRKEWPCHSRSPKMANYWGCVKQARDEGYKIVSMAFLEEGEEWFDGEFREDLVDFKLHGFLDLGSIIGMFHLSSGVLSFPSFALPLCMAIKKKLFLIYGGYVPHKHLIDKRVPHSFIHTMEPSPFCFCMEENHNCNKEVDLVRLERKFKKFLLG